MEENREPTAREVLTREVLIECRDEVSKLRASVQALQKENTLLHREKEMIISLFERGNREGACMSSDPLFDRIQREIQLLHNGE